MRVGFSGLGFWERGQWGAKAVGGLKRVRPPVEPIGRAEGWRADGSLVVLEEGEGVL